MNIFKAAIGALQKFPKGDSESVQLSGFRSLKSCLVEPELMELARAGRLFIASTTAVAGARAPVQDVPTTTANWGLYNVANNPRNLVPISIAAYLGSGTAGAGISLIAGVTPGPLATAVAANAANHGTGTTRGDAAPNTVFLGVNQTVPTMAAHFMVVAAQESTADAVPGSGLIANVRGMFVVRPTYALAVDIIAGAGTAAKFNIAIMFAMLEADLD